LEEKWRNQNELLEIKLRISITKGTTRAKENKEVMSLANDLVWGYKGLPLKQDHLIELPPFENPMPILELGLPQDLLE
jgi:hypothetical protein